MTDVSRVTKFFSFSIVTVWVGFQNWSWGRELSKIVSKEFLKKLVFDFCTNWPSLMPPRNYICYTIYFLSGYWIRQSVNDYEINFFDLDLFKIFVSRKYNINKFSIFVISEELAILLEDSMWIDKILEKRAES